MMSNLKDDLIKRINGKTKPLGSLGLLEEVALQIGMIQQSTKPILLNPTMLVFAADHGLADEGISPFPKEITWQMVMNFVGGGAAINCFCRQNGIHLEVIDAGVDYDFPEELPVVNAKVSRGTRNMMKEPAMTIEECELALERGGQIVADHHLAGCNVIGFGEMGIGNTSASSLLMHRFLNLPIESCTGAGAGMINDQLSHKQRILKSVSEKYDPQTPIETLATFGGLEVAMMAGGMLAACERGMVILIDGFIATAALLSAISFNPSVRQNALFCHVSNERGHRLMLAHLNAKPLLHLNLRLGEGTGAALAYPIVKAAVNFMNEMANMEDLG